jgi:hypothetical protein
MKTSEFFPVDYEDGRCKFLEAATAAGAEVVSYQNPLRGPEGERLFTDLAWIGPRDARRILLSMSGTHGVEGFAGSGIQTASLRRGLYRSLPDAAAVALVHAVTPFGFAWMRRANEDGVDVCRNFVDFTKPLPKNAAYDELARVLVPEDWTGGGREQADERYLGYIREHGLDRVKAELARGQYDYWFAPFFGGQAPTWSNRTFREILRTHLGQAQEVAAIDYHTGLGDYATGQLLGFHHPGEAPHERAAACWGETFASVHSDATVAYPITGEILGALEQELPDATITAAAYEFGTVDLMTVANAIRGDHWLHAYGDFSSPLAKEIKATIRDALYCDADDWRERIFELGVLAEQQALAMLGAS